MSVLKIKQNIRLEMREKRDKIDFELKKQYDNWVCDNIYKIINQKDYKNIHCYLPIHSEIDIYPLIEKLLTEDSTIICPKTIGNRELEHLQLSSLNNVEKGKFNTLYPKGNNHFKGEYDLILVPGLAFDVNNYRLGYGGGFYDEFLKNNQSAEKLGVFYPFQEVNKVPTEIHDIQLDNIVVNKKMCFFNG